MTRGAIVDQTHPIASLVMYHQKVLGVFISSKLMARILEYLENSVKIVDKHSDLYTDENPKGQFTG